MRQVVLALQHYQPPLESSGEVDAIAKLCLIYFVAEAEWQQTEDATSVAQVLQKQQTVRACA